MTEGSRAGPSEPLQAVRRVSTHVGFGTAVDHMEGAVGQVEASEAAGSLRGAGMGGKTHSQISDGEVKKGLIHTQRASTRDDSCLATTRQPVTHGDGLVSGGMMSYGTVDS